MNCTYRSIWNDTTGTFVAVSENAKSAGKKTSSFSGVTGVGARFCLQALAISVALSFGATAYALPTGGVVAAGSANISAGALGTTINQSTQNAAINWQSFNIASGESVRFNQPSSSSVTLNRVLGADPSGIFGSLTANGKVFLVNPNGILFGQGASVNVGGLVASTLNIADSDFMAGNYKFTGVGNGTVLNQGSINADGGYVALLGANVGNNGVISAKLGTVALAAGNAVTLDMAGDGLLNVTVNQGAVNALVQNGGLIQADGGQVLLTAQAAGSLLQSAVNNTGVIQAQTIQSHNGTIKLMGDMQSGTVNVGGTLDASGTSAGQTGGNVLVTGHHVGLFDQAKIDASGGGSVLIGGDFQGKNPNIQNASATYMSADSAITADAITNGNGGKVVLWSNDSTRAYGSISARGGAQGGDGGLIETSGHWLDVAGIKINANAPYGKSGTWLLDPTDVTIQSLGPTTTTYTNTANTFADNGANAAASILQIIDLQNALIGANITVSTAGAGLGAGNITVADALTWPTHILTLNARNNVNIDAAVTGNAIGSGLKLIAGNNVNVGVGGALVFSNNGSMIEMTAGNDVLATAAVTATGSGAVIDMSAGHNVSVVAVTADGGGATNSVILRANNDVLVNNAISATGGNVLLHADSDGTGPGLIGGTVKFVAPGSVVASTNTAIRFNPDGYPATTGDIAAYDGLVTGILDAKAWVFAKGTDKPYDGLKNAVVSGIKPLLGVTPAGTLTTDPGILFDTKDVGTNKPISYTGGVLSGGTGEYVLWAPYGGPAGSGTTTASITAVPLSITANSDSKTYDGAAYSGGNGVIYASFVGGEDPTVLGGALAYGGTSQGAVNAGNYVIAPSGLTSTNYAISYVKGALTVNAAPVVVLPDLTVFATNQTKPYGQTMTLTEFTSVGLLGGETIGTVTLTSVGTPATAAIGPYAITASNARGGTFVPGNYSIGYVNGVLTVVPAALTITAANISKIYGQTPTLSAFTTAGLLNGDTVGSVTETSPGQPATANVATYAITPSAATGGTFVPANYTIGYVNGVLTVAAIPLTVTASNVAKSYGQTPILSAFTTAGLINGDTVGSVTETSPGQPATANVATYAITPSAATGGTFVPANYTIGYVDGVLTVAAIPLTVTASNVAKSYGQTPILSAFTTAGLINSDTVGSVTETSPGQAATANVATYAITPSAATGGTFVPANYTIGYVNGVLTVAAIPLTVTASNVAKSYGQTPALTAFTTAGLINGDTVGSVTETSPGQVATAPVVGSPYAITPSAATGGTFVPANYTIGYVNGVLTVALIPLTVTANDVTKAFGQAPTLSGFTTTSLVNGETVGSVTETSPGQVATAPVLGSPYPITPTAATGGTFTPSNYTIGYVDGKLTVIQATLTVKADNALKFYGQTITLAPTAFTTTGLVNADTVTSVNEVSPGTVATAPALGSPYPITPSAAAGSYVPSNYSVNYVNGALTVTPTPLLVTANDTTKSYGDTPILWGFTTNGLVNDETVGSVTATSLGTAAGASASDISYLVTPSAATGGTFEPSNYEITYEGGAMTVLPVIEEGQNAMPVVVRPWVPTFAVIKTPPQLSTLASLVPPVVPVIQAPMVVQEQAPIVAPVETPPQIYVAPHRPRKQDRN